MSIFVWASVHLSANPQVSVTTMPTFNRKTQPRGLVGPCKKTRCLHTYTSSRLDFCTSTYTPKATASTPGLKPICQILEQCRCLSKPNHHTVSSPLQNPSQVPVRALSVYHRIWLEKCFHLGRWDQLLFSLLLLCVWDMEE